jgi:hypothetical protein
MDAGIASVVAVAAYVEGNRRVFEDIAIVENLAEERAIVPFRSLLTHLFDGKLHSTTVGPLGESPRRLRIAFEQARAKDLIPLSRLIVLNHPRTGKGKDDDAEFARFNEPAILEMLAVDGFLNENVSLESLFRKIVAADK